MLNFEGPNGLYYKEIFFHVPFLIANQLNANQQFDDAQKWYHYIYNPMISLHELGVYKKDLPWRYLPLRNLNPESLASMLSNPQALYEYHNNPFKPHEIAAFRPVAYQKAIVMKYIDNLIDWGDYLFSLDTWESITEATMVYCLAYDLLGPRPEKLDPCRTSEPKTYKDIKDQYANGGVPEFLIDLENTSSAASAGTGENSLNNNFTYYFCVPENKEFIEYWNRVETALGKIRHCMNIKGIIRQLVLYEPPISPMALVRAAVAGRDISSVLSEVLAQIIPYYRFNYMIEKAKSFTSAVQQLGLTFMGALEKKDGEELSLFKTRHEQNIQKMTAKVKEKQLEEAIESLTALTENKRSAITRNKHYKQLIQKGLSRNENLHIASMMLAWYFENMSNIMSSVSSAAHLVPSTGSPIAMTYGGRDVGPSLDGVAKVFHALASYTNLIGSMSSTMGSYERRREEWGLQEKMSQHDIDQIDRQIKAAELRKLIAEKEIEIHEKILEQTDQVYDFMKDKFTSKDLYQWMSSQLQGVYFQAYKMAYELAKSAERAFHYERNSSDIYVNFGHWDSLKKGLLAGEKLMLELNQLEKAYIEENARTFEIEKSISLNQLDPKHLLDVKQNGKCEFELAERLFDLDFPGHYCRKIKTISISVPAVVGPYENIKATLTQLSNKILVEPDTSAVTFNGNFEVVLDAGSPKVKTDWRVLEQIAISKGVNDHGMFELNFRDERYLPFEGTGAVSSWRLEMPQACNQFDFDSVSDVIINLKYTSLFDGSLQKHICNNLTMKQGYRMLSLRHEFSSEWHRFMHPSSCNDHELKLTISPRLFPPNISNYKITDVYVKIDLAAIQLPFSNNEKLSIILKPGSANRITFQYGAIDTASQTPRGDAIGEWIISVDRTAIPQDLRKVKEDGSFEGETVDGVTYFYLDPTKLKNIGIVLSYEGDISWPVYP
jgi:hypothetical protein